MSVMLHGDGGVWRGSRCHVEVYEEVAIECSGKEGRVKVGFDERIEAQSLITNYYVLSVKQTGDRPITHCKSRLDSIEFL